MSLVVPKFVYDPGTGPVTFTPTYPAVQKPGADELDAIRHDSDTISGIRQSIFERIDVYRTLQFDSVPQSDEANWTAFMTYALTGGSFNYYPDSTLTPFITFTLDDTNWAPALNFLTTDKFKLKLRQVLVTS